MFGAIPQRLRFEPESDDFVKLRREIEEYNKLTDAQKIAKDWSKVSGYLWGAMDKFEAQYREGFVKEEERERTHEETFARFKKLTGEYDIANIRVKCCKCETKRWVSKLQWLDRVQCPVCGDVYMLIGDEL